MMMTMIWPDYQADHDLWLPLPLTAKKKTFKLKKTRGVPLVLQFLSTQI